MKHLMLFTIILTSCLNDNKIKSMPEIDVWYGLHQKFGIVGNPQKQINILGNFDSDQPGLSLSYRLNDEYEKFYLTLGSDMHRLALPGDFNIEIFRNDLKSNGNEITIYIEDRSRVIDSTVVIINYEEKNIWPLPYFIDWGKVENIQDVAEVVDGEWEITDRGIRTKNMYYDRMIAFGDESWRNYEVETTVVFHDFVMPAEGPPTYNVSHAAIATRWPGHTQDGLQPSRQWYPLGATSEFRLEENYENCRWRIFDGEIFYAEQSQKKHRKIQQNKIYGMKHRVENISENQTLYSVKLWDLSNPEPADWDFQAVENSQRKESGSACLIAHNTDVTFGNVKVVSLK